MPQISNRFSNSTGLDKTQIKSQLRTMLILTMIACVLFGGIVSFFYGFSYISLIIAGPVFLLCLVSIIFLHFNHVHLSTHIFMFGSWILFTLINLIFLGGLDSPAIGLYFLIIITVGLTLGQKASLLYSLLCILAIIGLYVSSFFDVPLSNPMILSFDRKFIIYSMNIIMTALLVRIALQNIKEAMTIAKINEKNLEARNIELNAIRSDLEKRVEDRTKEIFKQRKFYESLVHHGPVAIVSLNTDHKITACNPEFERLFGYSQQEVLHQDIDNLINNQHTLSEAKSYTNLVKNGNPIRSSTKRVRKDGQYIDVEIIGIPVVYDNECIGLYAIYHDITEQINAKEALIRSEERYRSLFENSPISLWEEDFSEVKQYLDSLKQEGVKDFVAHFSKHPEDIKECVKRIKIININQASVDIYKAKSKEDLLSGLMKLTHGNSYDAFKDEFTALA